MKYFNTQTRIFCATQYYFGINRMIQTKFGVPGLSITEEQYQLIYSILAYYCQNQKN